MKTESASNLDLRNWEIYSPYYDQISKDIYGQKGYYIFRNFLSEDELSECLKHYSAVGKNEVAGQRTKFRESPEFLIEILLRIVHFRVRVGLQPSSDGFLFHYALLKGIFSGQRGTIYGASEIKESLINEGWYRFMCYKNGESWEKHLDSVGEIQSILYLTEQGKDFEKGGLKFADIYDEEINDVCGQMKRGDLILINAFKKVHWVERIECTPQQKGRITIFIPGYPIYG